MLLDKILIIIILLSFILILILTIIPDTILNEENYNNVYTNDINNQITTPLLPKHDNSKSYFVDYHNIRNTDMINNTPNGLFKIVDDTRSKLEFLTNEIEVIKQKNKNLTSKLQILSNTIEKTDEIDFNGDYIINGWFVQFHNVIETPSGIILGAIIDKIYGASAICFRTKDNYPFLGTPDKPVFFPKADYTGFRASTILKIPKTGYYDFRVITSDGIRLFYQKVTANVIENEKNARSKWIVLINSWIAQAEVWLTTEKIYFNENDLIFIRMEAYELTGYASGCIKYRYYENNIKIDQINNDPVKESDLPYKNLFCSLLWTDVPLLGFS